MPVALDPRLASVREPVPATWATRASFFHPLSADRWNKALDDASAAESDADVLEMFASIIEKVTGKVDEFISFGAGDGLVDWTLTKRLSIRALKYVAIDLSQDMCGLAIERMSQFAAETLTVVTDFEGDMGFLRDAISDSQSCSKFIGCASVLGNLDLAETNFLRNVETIAQSENWLFLSFGTGGFGGPINRSMLGNRLDWENLRGVLSCGISMHTGEEVSCVEDDIATRLDARSGTSDVPGAETVVLWDRKSGAGLMHFRRYDVEALAKWIERSFKFKVLYNTQLPFSDSGLGVAAMLLRAL
jgi:hypothetical protein